MVNILLYMRRTFSERAVSVFGCLMHGALNVCFVNF
nr:MAG TPA: hypothetical protein [Caudoviricetes sp.]